MAHGVPRLIGLLIPMALAAGCVTTRAPNLAEGYVVHGVGRTDSGWYKATGAAPDNPVPRTRASVERGRQIYVQRCLACHGSRGEGDGPAVGKLDPPPANLYAIAGKYPDHHLFLQISMGREGMNRWRRTLDERDIWDLANFIQSLPRLYPPEGGAGGEPG